MIFHGNSRILGNMINNQIIGLKNKGYDKAVLLKIDGGFPQSRIFATALLIVSHDGSMVLVYIMLT